MLICTCSFETLVRSEKRVPGETFIHVAMQDAFFLSVHELLESKGPYIPKVRQFTRTLSVLF
jgi:hypothetical protein